MKEGVLTSAIMECQGCTHRFLHTDEQSHKLTELSYTHDYVGFRIDPVFAVKARDAVECELKPLVGGGRLLDVGCGNGEFLRVANEAGYSVRGVDISEPAIEKCKAQGFEAEVGDFPAMDFGETFDCITMWDVIEHLRDPVSFMEKARRSLNPGGVLFLKIPGFGPGIMPMAHVSPRLTRNVLSAPQHVQFFNPRSCEAAIARAGFGRTVWFPPRRFRSKPETRSIKRHISRAATTLAARICGAGNLLVACLP